MKSKKRKVNLVSIVFSFRNEEKNINELVKRTSIALKKFSYELIFVNDNSSDKSLDVLKKLNTQNELSRQILFVIDNDDKVIGSLTDGDIRRALISNFTLESKIDDVCNKNYERVQSINENEFLDLNYFRKKNLKIAPIIDANSRLINIIDLNKTQSVIPVTAIIMAGGRGKRLSPLTDDTPKPLLKVADVYLIEHVILHLIKFGIKEIIISINYLGDKIKDEIGNGEKYGISISYINEEYSMGTAGSISLIDEFNSNSYLITNADVLTDIDFEKMYKSHLENNSDLTVASNEYQVNIPFAVFEMDNNRVISSVEKPIKSYKTNAGIYLVKANEIKKIPNKFYNMTDLIDDIIDKNGIISTFDIKGYWIDIGRPDDFEKANKFFNKN
jgi:dTDP-glucose pyrophosphorylase/predicted transcriptional regulator